MEEYTTSQKKKKIQVSPRRSPSPPPYPPPRRSSPPIAPKKSLNRCVYSGLKYISGPISWYFFQINGRSFHFFGDEHQSKEGNCESVEVKCSSMRNKTRCDCFDILYLLDTIFINAEESNNLVDFFIEIPYLRKGEKLSFNIGTQDYIVSILNHYVQCFQTNKEKCPFRNTRFHYADVRQNIKQGLVTLHGYIKDQMDELNKLIGYKYLVGTSLSEKIRKEIVISADWINLLIDKFFTENKNQKSLGRRYFDSHFSKDYIQELDDIYKSLITNIDEDKYSTQIKAIDKLFQTMKGLSKSFPKRSSEKKLHVIKIQLEELKKDIESNPDMYPMNLSDLIENFILSKSREYNLTEMKTLWKIYYNDFIGKIIKSSDAEELRKLYYFIYQKTYKELVYKLITSESLFMDAYTLARMFRTYTSSKNPTPFANMTITYTGDYHTTHYYEFFTDVLKVKPTASMKALEEAKRCIRDDKFSDYFKGYI